eukprot:5491670-Pyramimonas_sp.AAC.1
MRAERPRRVHHCWPAQGQVAQRRMAQDQAGHRCEGARDVQSTEGQEPPVLGSDRDGDGN